MDGIGSRHRSTNMRPASPILNFAAALRPSSPPQSPTALHAPFFIPKRAGPGPGPGPGALTPQDPADTVSQPPNAMFFGGGHLNPLRPGNPSPDSPCSSTAEVSEPGEPELSSDEDGSDSPGPSSPHHPDLDGHFVPQARVPIEGNFVIEELSDFGDDDMQGRDDVIRPHKIEYAESERSRSRTRLTPDDPHMINDLQNLKCRSPDPNSSSDDSDLIEDEHEARTQSIRAAERRQRMSQGSIGTKRTMSERGSDSDHEDVRHYIGFEELGSSARRLKRRVAGDRRSINFSDPPPRIDEVIEPEELDETLARELPFYEYIRMEVDSPRSP